MILNFKGEIQNVLNTIANITTLETFGLGDGSATEDTIKDTLIRSMLQSIL
jgi:hypothetical protein